MGHLPTPTLLLPGWRGVVLASTGRKAKIARARFGTNALNFTLRSSLDHHQGRTAATDCCDRQTDDGHDDLFPQRPGEPAICHRGSHEAAARLLGVAPRSIFHLVLFVSGGMDRVFAVISELKTPYLSAGAHHHHLPIARGCRTVAATRFTRSRRVGCTHLQDRCGWSVVGFFSPVVSSSGTTPACCYGQRAPCPLRRAAPPQQQQHGYARSSGPAGG